MILSKIENTTIELVIMLRRNIFRRIRIIKLLASNIDLKNEHFHFENS